MTPTHGRDIRHLVPDGFEYVHIENGQSGNGVAFVVDDKSRLPVLSKEAMLGQILNQCQKSFDDDCCGDDDIQAQGTTGVSEQERHSEFVTLWKPFDWSLI